MRGVQLVFVGGCRQRGALCRCTGGRRAPVGDEWQAGLTVQLLCVALSPRTAGAPCLVRTPLEPPEAHHLPHKVRVQMGFDSRRLPAIDYSETLHHCSLQPLFDLLDTPIFGAARETVVTTPRAQGRVCEPVVAGCTRWTLLGRPWNPAWLLRTASQPSTLQFLQRTRSARGADGGRQL
jgi:hypothetical protein